MTRTHTGLSNYPRIPFDNPNSCIVQRRLPLIVLSGNAIGRNFLVCASVDAGDYAMYVVRPTSHPAYRGGGCFRSGWVSAVHRCVQ